MTTSLKLRVAIIGGGIAGTTIANALLPHDHISWHIYEGAPEFSERGAAVGVAINAQLAMSEISSRLRETLDRGGGTLMHSSRIMIGSGPHAGSFVFDVPNKGGPIDIHRAAFLKELLAPLPKERLHVGKKLSSISTLETGALNMQFKDGTTEEVDAVIGADGIHGLVRKHVLGAQATDPVFAGWWDCRNVVPLEKAKEKLGEELFEVDRLYGWAGDGGFLMFDTCDHGKSVQVIASKSSQEKWRSDEWRRPYTKEFLENEFKTWNDTPIAQGVIDLLVDQEDLRIFSMWEHENAPTYSNGSVCIMGDAAHAFTPWQGSGAGMAIEDAMILGTVLGAAKTAADLPAAFKAYDEVRRPRRERVAESSHGTGMIMCGQVEEIGLDLEKLREALPPRWVHIYAWDPKEHKKEALAAMAKYK